MVQTEEKGRQRQGGGNTGNACWESMCWEAFGAQGGRWDSHLEFPSSDYYGKWWGLSEALKLRAELNVMPLVVQPRF